MTYSFRLKTVIGIALIETIALCVLIWSSINYLSESNQQAVAKRAESTIQLFAAMTQDSIISMDLAKLESMVNEIMKVPEIMYVRIYGHQNILAEAGAQGQLNKPFKRDLTLAKNDDDIFDIDTEITIQGSRFGRIELGFSIRELEQLVEQAGLSLGLIAIIEIIAVALFSLALGAYLTQSLKQLKDASDQIKMGDLGVTVPVTSQDEIGEVALAFNQMSKQIQDNHRFQDAYFKKSKQLTEDLKRSELRMRTVMNTAIDGFVIINAQGIIVEVNESTESTFGYPRQKMIGQNVSMLMPEDYASQHDSYLQRYLSERVPKVIGTNRELTGLRQNGETFPMELTVSEIRQEDEVLFVGLVHDLTNLRQVENKVSYLEAIKNGITEASLDALITIDDQGSIVDFNTSAENMYGLNKASVLGRNISEVIIPEAMREAHHNGMQRYLKTREGPVIGKRIEVTSIRNGSEEFPVELTVTPIQVRDKTFFTAFIRDITEQNQQKETLREAITAAESANEAKSKFLASMSHEIRTPINAILGSLDLMDGCEKVDLQNKKYIQIAKNSGQSLLSIVNNILDFSKIESGAMEITESEFSLYQLIDDVVFMFGATAEEKNIEIQSIVNSDVPQKIHSDKGKIRQVLINLVSNAIKFTSSGGITIFVKFQPMQEQSQLELTIQDSGIGISPEEIPNLFRDFSQVENQLSAEYDGSGLGLSICKSLAEIMGGQISVTSTPEIGSEFRFQLPIKDFVPNQNMSNIQPAITKARIFSSNTVQKIALEMQLKIFGVKVLDHSNEPYDVAIIDESLLQDKRLIDDQAKFRVLLTYEDKLSKSRGKNEWDHIVLKPVMNIDWQSILNADFSTAVDSIHSHQTLEMPPITGKHILVVDDSEANQFIAKGMLEKAGYLVSLADNGEQAVERVKNEKFDLVLMDMRMPKMDGITATTTIRSSGISQATIPIVALTANAVKEDLEKCIEAGMNAYLTKPINKEDMLKNIMEILDTAGTQSNHVSTEPTADSDSLVDCKAFDKLAEETSPDLVDKMVEIFIKESKQRVQVILQSDIPSQLSEIGREAHTLKSTAITFGALSLHQVTRALELACKEPGNPSISELVHELETVANKTFHWFDRDYVPYQQKHHQ